jgi:hypothetical protein
METSSKGTGTVIPLFATKLGQACSCLELNPFACGKWFVLCSPNKFDARPMRGMRDTLCFTPRLVFLSETGEWRMHPEAYSYVETQSRRIFRPDISIVEFGGRNVNGTIRSLFDTPRYLAIDIVDGPGVDIVADASDWQPPEPVDGVICCEVLEHTPKVRDIINNAARMLRPSGWLLVTCAAPLRDPHSAVDGGKLREDEYYENICSDRVVRILTESDPRTSCPRWTDFEVTVGRRGLDLYFLATKA